MQSKDYSNKINEVVETALNNLNDLIKVDTVIAKPIKDEDGALVFPVAKITLGVLVGGGEYGKTGIFKKEKDLPFTAGNGAVVSVKPCGFLVKDKSGEYKTLTIAEYSCEKIFDKAVDFINNIVEKTK